MLAATRAATLILLVLLLVDPRLPASASSGSEPVPWVLLDASVSMSVVGAEGVSPWDRAVAWVSASAPEEARIVRFGAGASSDEGGLTPAAPDQLRSRLLPALERAVEAGASEIFVVSDMRLEDGREAVERLRRVGAPITFRDVGGPTVNAGIDDFRVPATVASTDSISVEVAVFAERVVDSLEVRVSDAMGVLAQRTLAAPPSGRAAVVQLRLPPPRGRGFVPYSASVRATGDAFTEDDERRTLVEVDPEAGGLVLVSLAADWEPRFLIPVLEQVTGLPPYGYLRLADGRFLSLEAGPGGGRIVEGEEIERRAAGAELLVVHGEAGEEEPWLTEASAVASRLILFASGPAALTVPGLSAGDARPGEWYVSAEPTPSQLAGSLTAIPWQSLPPLTALLPLSSEAGLGIPLRARLQGSGAAQAVIALAEDGSKRRAVVLASGFWRWAFRPGVPRDAYRRLWSAVGGWLLANEPVASGPGVQPVSRVWQEGVPIGWRASGRENDDLVLEVSSTDSPVLFEGAVEQGNFSMPSPGPGQFDYRVVDEETGETVGNGRFLVESYRGDMRTPRMDVPDLSDPSPGREDARTASPGRPLRTHPVPYLLVIALLCAEWIVRRRRGLR